MRDVLPNGLLGLAIAGLLAAFMAGMAANISAFNTVFSYDLWQRYIRKDHSDDYYLRIGRLATVGATVIAIFTAIDRQQLLSNIMDYLQTLFGFFNAPLFATFILGMFWKRMTRDGRLGRPRRPARCRRWSSPSSARTRSGRRSLGVIPLSGRARRSSRRPRRSSSTSCVSVVVSLVTEPKPASELRGPRLLRDAAGGPASTRRSASCRGSGARCPLAGIALGHGHHPQLRLLTGASTMTDTIRLRRRQPARSTRPAPSTSATSSAPCSASTA